MIDFRKLLSLSLIILYYSFCHAQRAYKPTSVLANGNWYKISITNAGVYKIDVAFLNSLGITGAIPSNQVRLYGNGGGMLPEANSMARIDDIQENSIWIEDGGDGILNGTDYLLFYSNGPDEWLKDSAAKRFNHRKNLYSDKAFYFITVGGTGKRVQTQTPAPGATSIVTSFDERYFHESDSINFLSSGKEWFGEELSFLPGRSLSRSFVLPLSDLIINQPATIISSLAARSINASAKINVLLNGQNLQQIDIAPLTTGLYELFARPVQKIDNTVISQSTATVIFTYSQGGTNSQAWLNWFEFFARRNLTVPPGKQLLFRDWNSLGNSAVEFVISNAESNTQVWDVTDPLAPVKMITTVTNNQLRFSNDAQQLREYVTFAGNFLTPLNAGRIGNQNLHASTNADYLIITHPTFLSQAQRLATFHQQRNNLQTVIATTDQIFNEFSSGIPDPTAIRDFVKMYYDKNRSTWSATGKYLLLFGKASFDYKDRLKTNTNFVPCYETFSSVDPLSSYTSDDFFAILDDNEDINSSVILNTLDIGIGRIPVKTNEEAKNFVDKLYDYHSAAAFGPWRNQMNFIADDEDQNLHLQDAEVLTATVKNTAPDFNPDKIYLDAYRQESGSAGGRYPQANTIINSNISNGVLIWNYSGHGGPERLAEEVVLDASIINNWKNQYRLPLFITATCDFAPYDKPTINSLGENLIIRPKTGAIALMTTTRVVFANSNRIINDNYLRIALQPDVQGRYKSLGEAVQQTKNFTYQTSGDINNNRKFTLLGDPAMTLAFPLFHVKVDSINGKSTSTYIDTLSATEKIKITGSVTDINGTLLNDFNGTVYLSVFDKPAVNRTLANDATSVPVDFVNQTGILFKGKATAEKGKFSIEFKMPKDINYQFGNGKVSLYAEDGKKDGNGIAIVSIGGIEANAGNDVTGPEIKGFLNDDKFVNGSITNSNPILIVRLSDSSGINTGSSGIDHDIIATLDNDNKNYFVLNNFYETELNNYQKGTIRFQLPELPPGPHTLKIKAWDVMNNSSEYVLDFTVVNNEEIRIDHVLNYPNPFSTNTTFWFEHNQPATDLYTKVEIFTISGKLIKTINQTINTTGNRSNEIHWNGTDEYGNKIGRGVYVYRIKVRNATGKTSEKWERIVLIN